jgi:hypothetical protein
VRGTGVEGFLPPLCGLDLQDGGDDLDVGQENQAEGCHQKDDARSHYYNLVGGDIHTGQSDYSQNFTGYMINTLVCAHGKLKGDRSMDERVDGATDPRTDGQPSAQSCMHYGKVSHGVTHCHIAVIGHHCQENKLNPTQGQREE